MDSFEARLGKPSDYHALVRLCRRAVGPGDYVLRYLRQVIRGQGLFLAFHDRMLVGMTSFEKCIDGSGWLGMARTDPDWRRRGVALFLQETIASDARKRGIKTLRLWVHSTNTPALNACRKGGDWPICKMVHVSQLLRPLETHGFSPVPRVPKQLIDSILASNYLAKMNGYMAYKWHIVKPDQKVLEEACRRQELYRVEERFYLISAPDKISWNYNKWKRHSEFTLLQGPVKKSFSEVREIVRSLGVAFLAAYLPYDNRLLSTARAQGFRRDAWGDHCIVFEKRLA